MKLLGLKPLFGDLLKKNNTFCIFKFQKNQVLFDIFFDIASNPFRLGFLVLKNDFQLWIDVHKGFLIDNQLNSNDYYKLIKLLNLQTDSKNKFSTFAFFEEFNKKIPQYALQVSSDYARNLIVHTLNIEDKDKIYYTGLIEWDKIDNKRKRTLENLEKTRLLYPDLYLRIKDRNISVKYSSDKNDNKNYL